MKKLVQILTINAAAIFMIALVLMAIGLLHLDSSHKIDKRAAHEQFIKETAMPYKNLISNQEGQQKKAGSPDMASLQEFL